VLLVSKQESMQRPRDVRNFFHFLLRCRNQLLDRELAVAKAVVGYDVLAVRVILIAAEELEVWFVTLNNVRNLFEG
jgi:hypothetical protein